MSIETSIVVAAFFLKDEDLVLLGGLEDVGDDGRAAERLVREVGCGSVCGQEHTIKGDGFVCVQLFHLHHITGPYAILLSPGLKDGQHVLTLTHSNSVT